MATLNFKGKSIIQNYHYTVKYHQLISKKDKSLTGNISLQDNLIIHGDNLKSLKALLPIYSGKIDVICIDPPYNSGETRWVYSDNVNSNSMLQEWFGKVVDKEDLTKHDKWLCMMTPRLKMMKELLSQDGLIAIAIDDEEVFNLGLLMDEIFEPDNRLACAPWLSDPSGGKQKSLLRIGHEYVLIYKKNSLDKFNREVIAVSGEIKQDEYGQYRIGRELNKWGSESLREDRPEQWYPLKAPDGTEVFPIRNDGKEGRWRWGRNNSKVKEILDNPEHAHWEIRKFDEGVTYNGKTERWFPYEKIREDEKLRGWRTWLDNVGFNSDATREIKEIFGEKIFDTPKPTSLMKWLINQHGDDSALILDSFAGTGTTGHAVLALNKEDNGNRRFILIQCDEFNKKTGKTENICNSITAERIRRVIKGVPTAKDKNLKEGLGGTFSYFELGDPIEMESILEGDNLPTYDELARYVFYTATGEEFDSSRIDESRNFIGETKECEVYLFYKPDIDYLKSIALTLDRAKGLGSYNGKKRLVFAPNKYLDNEYLLQYRIEYCQLPFEIYKLKD